jgi:glycosyltransferase involved in cell wall biosynthesis
MKNNILLVSQVFHPNTQSTSLLLNDLALNIQSENTKITAISGFPNGVDNDIVKRYENFQGIDIYRCGLNVDLKSGIVPRILSYISYLPHAAWKVIFYPDDCITIGITNPPFLAIMLGIVSKLAGRKFYFIMHDVYPEGLIELGKLKESSMVVKLWRRLNQMSYHRSEKIVVLGRDMQDLLVKNYQIDPEKIEIIPNWSLTRTATRLPLAENSLAQELEIADKFIVQYSGNMGIWHDIDSLIKAAGRLQHIPDIQFLFIGNGIRQKQAQQLAKDLQLNNISWMDFVPQQQLATSLSCSHLALISLNAGLEGIAVPCKLYGILASGRAIIGQVPANSEIAYVIEEENCGFVVAPGDIDGLVDKIKQLYHDRELTEQMGLNAFEAYRSKYTINNIVEKFQKMLNI